MNDYNFGNYLYELRAKKGLSQTELAEMLGVTNKAISKWETGAAYPSSKIMYPLAKALGTSIEQLYSLMQSDGKQKNPVRRLLDKVFKYKKLTVFLPISLASVSYLLFILFGEMPDKIRLLIITPVVISFVFGGLLVGFLIQLKNPMCPSWFFDMSESFILGASVLSSVIFVITFLSDMKTGYTATLPLVLSMPSIVSIVHNKRNR